MRKSAPEASGLPQGFNARRLRANLLACQSALDRLEELGVDATLVGAAGLGMKEPYLNSAGVETRGVATYPLEAVGGRWRYGYIAIEGVTLNPSHPVAWSPGEPRSLRHGRGRTLLVLASPVEVLQARAAIDARGLDVAAVASSQPEAVPPEWDRSSYWSPWERVVLSDGIPSTIRRRIAERAGRPVEVAAGSSVEPSPDIPIAEILDEWLEGMLSRARPFVPARFEVDLGVERGPGDYETAAIDLRGGVVAGRMYYPFSVERRRAGPSGGAMVCSYETVVLRSDGAIVEARTLPAPAGTPAHQRVHALTDGTRIHSPPAPNGGSSWSLRGIRDYVARRAAGEEPCVRPAEEIMRAVRDVLAARVALPREDDLWVCAAFVAMTHVFRVFPALPLLLVEGAKGTGKTELGSAIASLSFNSVTMGQGSAAALVRVSRECGGLVVLDDVEALGASAAGFSELSQCLKVGYRASTAVKPVVLPSGRVETFDFFGPRVLTCTRSVEPVLASRCVRVCTAPPGDPGRIAEIQDVSDLRDELHALAMSRVSEVATALRDVPAGGDRRDEIWSPLQAVARAFAPLEGIDAIARARSVASAD